jgi:hypothetical protein
MIRNFATMILDFVGPLVAADIRRAFAQGGDRRNRGSAILSVIDRFRSRSDRRTAFLGFLALGAYITLVDKKKEDWVKIGQFLGLSPEAAERLIDHLDLDEEGITRGAVRPETGGPLSALKYLGYLKGGWTKLWSILSKGRAAVAYRTVRNLGANAFAKGTGVMSRLTGGSLAAAGQRLRIVTTNGRDRLRAFIDSGRTRGAAALRDRFGTPRRAAGTIARQGVNIAAGAGMYHLGKGTAAIVDNRGESKSGQPASDTAVTPQDELDIQHELCLPSAGYDDFAGLDLYKMGRFVQLADAFRSQPGNERRVLQSVRRFVTGRWNRSDYDTVNGMLRGSAFVDYSSGVSADSPAGAVENDADNQNYKSITHELR